ncbi:MAG TPA: hypothetical protein VJT73_01120 [Polyangiaceae bacterium]|nr:hypothetical protein [Polyangiaceae bacterium]
MQRLSAGLFGALCLLLASGCPSNTCFLTVNGKCTWSSCPDGAEFVTAQRKCMCQPGRIALNGACLTAEAANQYCGKGAHFENGGCAPTKCPPGLEIDQDTGYCLSPQQATQVASNMGVSVGQNQKLGCPPGEKLVVEGQQAACVPLPQSCGRDEVWDGAQCRKGAQCPPGSSYDAPSNSCIKFATGPEANEYTVDLATWVRASYGPEGGAGTPGFCGAFNKHPLAFGIGAGKSLKVKVAVQIQAPANQVAKAYAFTAAVSDPGGQPVAAKGAAEIQQAAQTTLASLVAGGGKSQATAASTSVTCSVVNSSKPTAVTVTGGV